MVFFCNNAEDLEFELRLNNCVAIVKHGSSEKYASPQEIPGYNGPDHMDVWRTPEGSALFRKMLHGTPLEEEDRKTLEHIKGLNRALQDKKN